MRALLLCTAAVCVLLGAELAGQFKGDWSSNSSGASGAIQLIVKSGPDAVHTSEATFTLSGTEVKTKIRMLQIAGNDLVMSYDFGNEGTQLTSKLKGKLDGDKLSGTYQTTITGQTEKVDEGTFKTILVK